MENTRFNFNGLTPEEKHERIQKQLRFIVIPQCIRGQEIQFQKEILALNLFLQNQKCKFCYRFDPYREIYQFFETV
jgi:hypothetical protein